MIEVGALRWHALAWDGVAGEAPVLLVHATSLCADAWRPAWKAARADGASSHPALAIDQRGHGRSVAPAEPEDYRWTCLAKDVDAVAAALAAEHAGARVVGVGHSSGATALLAAAGAAPDRFTALVAIEPVLFDAPDAPGSESFRGSHFLAGAARRRRNAFASIDEAWLRLRAKPPLAGFDPACFEAILGGALSCEADGSVALRCPGEREAWCYEGAAALDLWPLAEKIRVPLLLVLGEHGAVAHEHRDRLLACVPDLRIETIAGATHFAALERPREVGAAIARFLAALPR